MTLLILAAGMGSRFGGLKQIEPVGPNGEFIIDYSIYDAILNGFDKVVFVIKEENYNIFKETIGNRIADKIKVEYVFQKNDVDGIPTERVKPLGTAHAILCAKNSITDDFVIINADDFYGREGFETIAKYIRDKGNDKYKYGVVGYKVENTLTENGTVKRGVLDADSDGNLVKIIESSVGIEDGRVVAKPLNGDEQFYADNSLVSMNMISFTPYLFEALERDFSLFLKNANLAKDEFLIPDVLFKQVENNEVVCKILHTDAVWKGITYASDLDELKRYINNQVIIGKYPNNLYR